MTSTSFLSKLDILEEILRHQKPGKPKPWWALLPHETTYTDTGCDLHPSCLKCPLPRCVHDNPRGRQRLRRANNTAAARHLAAQGLTQAQIATAMNKSTRTVRRYLAHESPEHNKTRRQKCNTQRTPQAQTSSPSRTSRDFAYGSTTRPTSRGPLPSSPGPPTIRR